MCGDIKSIRICKDIKLDTKSILLTCTSPSAVATVLHARTHARTESHAISHKRIEAGERGMERAGGKQGGREGGRKGGFHASCPWTHVAFYL